MSWFYLALLAPFLYAIVNLLDDNLLKFVYKGPYLATAFAGLFGMLPLLSLLFLDAQALSAKLAIISLVTGILTTSYLFFYFKGLSADSPAIVVALLGLAPALLPLIAHFVLNERLSPLELIGFVIVLLASLALAVSDFKTFKMSKAVLPVLVAVLFLDIISIATKYVYDRTSFYSAYMYLCAGMGIGGVLFYGLSYRENNKSVKEIKQKLKQVLPAFIAVEMTAMLALFTLNLATSRGPVSLVKVVEGIQPMFVLLIALALHPFWPKYFHEGGEGHLLRKFALMGVIIIGLGVIGIAAK